MGWQQGGNCCSAPGELSYSLKVFQTSPGALGMQLGGDTGLAQGTPRVWWAPGFPGSGAHPRTPQPHQPWSSLPLGAHGALPNFRPVLDGANPLKPSPAAPHPPGLGLIPRGGAEHPTPGTAPEALGCSSERCNTCGNRGKLGRRCSWMQSDGFLPLIPKVTPRTAREALLWQHSTEVSQMCI